MEVRSHHYEIQWTLKVELEEGPLEVADVTHYKGFDLTVEIPERFCHESDFSPSLTAKHVHCGSLWLLINHCLQIDIDQVSKFLWVDRIIIKRIEQRKWRMPDKVGDDLELHIIVNTLHHFTVDDIYRDLTMVYFIISNKRLDNVKLCGFFSSKYVHKVCIETRVQSYMVNIETKVYCHVNLI